MSSGQGSGTGPPVPNPGPYGGADRRAYPRFTPAAGTTAHVLPAPDETARAVTVGDLSATGVSLVSGQAFSRGQTVVVQFRRDARRLRFEVEARVAFVRRLPGGAFRVGCTFLEPLADAQLRELL